MSAATLLALSCDFCEPAERPSLNQLHVTVDGRLYCSFHWQRAGRPWPKTAPTLIELEAQEIATRDRMLRRGGHGPPSRTKGDRLTHADSCSKWARSVAGWGRSEARHTSPRGKSGGGHGEGQAVRPPDMKEPTTPAAPRCR